MIINIIIFLLIINIAVIQIITIFIPIIIFMIRTVFIFTIIITINMRFVIIITMIIIIPTSNFTVPHNTPPPHPPSFPPSNPLPDVDECDFDLCAQRCINSEGSYSCQCLPGYKLDLEDTHECVGKLELFLDLHLYL